MTVEPFVLVSDDSGSWYQAVVNVDGHPVRVRIAPSLRDQCLPFASALCAELRSGSKYRAFVEAESLKQPEMADVIHTLWAETIDYVNPKRPAVGEVSLSSETGAEPWTCLVDMERFYDLQMEG